MSKTPQSYLRGSEWGDPTQLATAGLVTRTGRHPAGRVLSPLARTRISAALLTAIGVLSIVSALQTA